MPDSSAPVTVCPCCRSTVRVLPDEARLEIVRMTKPSAAEIWRPPKRNRRAPLPAPVIVARRNTAEREALSVVSRVAREAGVGLSELRSPSRSPDLVAVRRRAAAAARAETDASLPQIGRVLNRDHSTILYGLRAGAPS